MNLPNELAKYLAPKVIQPGLAVAFLAGEVHRADIAGAIAAAVADGLRIAEGQAHYGLARGSGHVRAGTFGAKPVGVYEEGCAAGAEVRGVDREVAVACIEFTTLEGASGVDLGDFVSLSVIEEIQGA